MRIQPVRLHGECIYLEPLTEAHVPGLAEAGRDSEIWRFLPYGDLSDETKLLEHVRTLLLRASKGTDLPFAVIHNETRQPIGCTRYFEISREHRRLEIGGTWYSPAYQRTRVNTECKYLLLKHAFDVLGCIRVQFKSHAKNIRSQRALERIGAIKEGVFRSHLILPDGGVRDSIYYSILQREWPAVASMLAGLLGRPAPNLATVDRLEPVFMSRVTAVSPHS